MSNYNKDNPIEFFKSTMWNAGYIFSIAIALGMVFSLFAIYFDELEYRFLEDTSNKISDAFNTVAAASLTGAMFLSLNFWKDKIKTN